MRHTKQQIIDAMIFKIKQALDCYENVTVNDMIDGLDQFAVDRLRECIMIATGEDYLGNPDNWEQIKSLLEEKYE